MTYRLLRDNAETGPYTKAELIEKGLKPYDLIWVEGKSAAWSYPNEIDELKYYISEERFRSEVDNPSKEKPCYRVRAIYPHNTQERPANSFREDVQPMLETKYSTSLHDLKKQYEEKVLNSAASNAGKKKRNSVLTPVLLSLPVLILGVIIGVIWKHDVEPTTLSSPGIQKESIGIFDTQKNDNLANTQALNNSDSSETSFNEPVVSTKDSLEAKTKDISVSKEKKPGSKRSINDVVNIKATYKTTASGIKNIKLNVLNRSYINLDLVVLELFYIDAGNKMIEKETIYLKNISSKEKQSVDAPNGGKQTKKIRYKVILVSAKDANLHLVTR